jgi:predicted ATPase/class 3 adenylate cyclase
MTAGPPYQSEALTWECGVGSLLLGSESMSGISNGTYTFLFTDIEGSTRLWETYPEAMRVALARHDAILRGAIEGNEGEVFKTIGDAFCAAFRTAPDGLAAAVAAQRGLRSEPWGEVGSVRVRMAMQTGTAEERDGDYFGPPLNRVARLLAAAHGGQVLLALPTAELVRDVLPDGVGLRDLGEHRLKDLVRPERVFQVTAPDLPAEFPRLRTLDYRPNNLPVQATPFVGRDKVVADARRELLRPDVRLLTLTGPGGTGKTRLALQVAADLIDHFEDGVFFVPLAPTNDPTMVAAAIAQSLGVQEAEGRPVIQILKDYLRDKRMLLVLDNFEQVLGAASLVADLLQSCPNLKILVTSRAVLHLYGGHDFPVPPLELPDLQRLPSLDRLSQYEAVRLFVERAQAIRPDFTITNDNAPAIAEICHRLDGLPLAIELAAARVRLLSPEAILARMERRLPLLTGGARDLPARQQTLRGAIAWGYELLDADEQALFRRLGAFAGGFTLEAAEAVCNPDVDLEVDLLDGVASLVDKSLLQQVDQADGEPRFSMLGTIREFALEQLEVSGEAETVRRRHAEHFLALAEEAAPRLRGKDQVAWLARLDTEHDNLRAALNWFARTGAVEERQCLAASLWWFWFLRSYLSEGRAWLEEALQADPAQQRSRARDWAAFVAGAVATLQSDFETARARLLESAAIFRELGDERGLAYPLIFLGQTSFFQADPATARTLYEEGLAVARRVGDTWASAIALFFSANSAFGSDEPERARDLAAESLALFRQAGDPWGKSMPLAVLGRLALLEGDHATARAQLGEALAARRLVGDKWGLAQVLNGVGDVARSAGDLIGARAAYEESLELFIETSSRAGIASAQHNLAHVAFGQGLYPRAATLFRDGLIEFHNLGDRRGMAECLAGLAAVIGAEGEPEVAARLFGAAESLLESIGAVIWPSNRADHERNVATARARLDPDTFAAAWAAGRALTAEQAVAEALATPTPA